MEKVVLKASKREALGRQVGALRRAGKLPAVMYGHGIASTPITLEAHEAALKLSHVTSSSLMMIDLDGTEYPALVREKQRDYLKNRLVHVDFQVISMTREGHHQGWHRADRHGPGGQGVQCRHRHRPQRVGGRVHASGPAGAGRDRHFRPG